MHIFQEASPDWWWALKISFAVRTSSTLQHGGREGSWPPKTTVIGLRGVCFAVRGIDPSPHVCRVVGDAFTV